MTIIGPSPTTNLSNQQPRGLPENIWQALVFQAAYHNIVNSLYSCITRPGFTLKFCRFSENEDFVLLHNTAFTSRHLQLPAEPANCLISQVSGQTELVFNDKLYKIRAGTSILLGVNSAAGNDHSPSGALKISLTPNAKIFVLRLPQTSIASTIDVDGEKKPVKNIGYGGNQSIARIIDKIDTNPCSAAHAKLFFLGKLYEIYAKIIEDKLAAPNNSDDSDNTDFCELVVRKAENILNKNISSPPTLESLVKIIGTNRNKLLKSFKAIHGMSIFEYCQRERMLLAQFMLENKSYSVAKIAESVGYKHPGNFSLAYKKHFGEAPKKVQKKSQL